MAPTSYLVDWENFYIIVGSSAAALTGLQFVVITLTAESGLGEGGAIAAFSTPTIIHFCAVLLVAAVTSAPWRSLGGPAVAITGTGILGAIYAAITVRRARRVQVYRLVMEDWLWHFVFPAISYAALIIAGLT